MSTPHTLVPAVPAEEIPIARGGTARLMFCTRCAHALLDQEVAPVTPRTRDEHLLRWGYDVLDCDDCLRARAQGLGDRLLSPGGSA